MPPDFTLSKFRTLASVVAENYPALTLAEYFKGAASGRFALLRHDIDRKPESALLTARIEQELGIRATYYFRMCSFMPEIMREIDGMGHEVGFIMRCWGRQEGIMRGR